MSTHAPTATQANAACLENAPDYCCFPAAGAGSAGLPFSMAFAKARKPSRLVSAVPPWLRCLLSGVHSQRQALIPVP